MLAFKKILCPIDFSEGSHQALEGALNLAKASGGELVLLHVYAPPIGYTDVMGPGTEQAAVAMAESLETELGRWKADAAGHGVPVTAVLKQGGACPEILRYAREGGFDTIVMGTHGRSGLGRLIIGSVAEKVVRKSAIPVLTIHPRPHEEARPAARQ
jgi:nucleotide-binding universal stress UspA family protein